jgi:hypothetical protein
MYSDQGSDTLVSNITSRYKKERKPFTVGNRVGNLALELKIGGARIQVVADEKAPIP